jgi:predicted DNA-binding protein
MKQQVTMKLWKETRTKLRLVSDLTNRPMCEILDEMIESKIESLNKNGEFDVIQGMLNKMGKHNGEEQN